MPSLSPCPECGRASRGNSVHYKWLRCDSCPLDKLDEAMASDLGRVFSHLIDLDFAVQSRLDHLTQGITVLEFRALQILAEERAKHQREQRDADQEQYAETLRENLRLRSRNG